MGGTKFTGDPDAPDADSAATARARDYPNRPITLTLPFPLGGSTGYTATVLARELEVQLGQPCRVEATTGHYGINALANLADNPDGYTLLVGNLISNSMTPVFHRGEFRFDYLDTIAPVSKLAEFPSVVMTHPSFPAQTLADLLAQLKQATGWLTYGTDFLGTYVDVDAIQLGKASGLDVAYHATDGANGILRALLAGQIDIAFINPATATANIGKFKPLAVYGTPRLQHFPDVLTMAEAGYPGIGTGNWQGLFACRRTPPDIIARLHRAAVAAMDTAAARQAFDAVDAAITTSASPQAFAQAIEAEMAAWQRMMPEVLALPQARRQQPSRRVLP
jgi:tripartite-type tricarboxylate transporter receptor subunit TctC